MKWFTRGLLVSALLCPAASALAQQPSIPQPATVDLTQEEAIRLALERNLDIAVERLNPQTYDLTIAALRSTYRPVLTSTFGQRSQVFPPTSQLNGGQRVENDTTTYNSGVAQSLPWGGGTVQLGFNNTRQETSNIFANYNPSYNSNFAAIFSQPLLRGFGIDGTRQQLLITRINRDISEVQLRATVANTLANVRNAYWDLLYAVGSLEAARGSLSLAEKLIEDNRTRVEVGTMAPIDVVQAEAEAATRRQALAQTEAQAQIAELALKRLIVAGTHDPLWTARLNPVDQPDTSTQEVDVPAAVRSALDRRTDLAQSRRQLEVNDINLRYFRNQTLPAVDLQASYGLQGLGGTQFVRQGSGLGSTITGQVPGGYRDALSAITGRDFPTWNLALNVSYPVFGSAADAQVARARVQQAQTQAQLRALELQVATEVTSAGLQVQSNLRRVEAARAARDLVEKRLEAEASKFDVGLSTNFFVVQAQRDLADARNVELRALLDYRRSLVEYERAQETSLGRAGITLATGTAGGGSTVRATGAASGVGGGGNPSSAFQP